MIKFSSTANRCRVRVVRLAQDRRGAVLLEATVFLPMLFFLAMGAFEFGRMFQHHHVVVKAVRDAGRFLARVPATCPGGSITVADQETTAKNLALTGVPSGGSPRLPYWTDAGSIDVAVDCFDNGAGTLNGKPFIPLITVTATVPYGDVGFLSLLGVDPVTFVVDHQEVNIGE